VITDLRCEYLADPVGIGEAAPRLSWVVSPDLTQAAYQVVADGWDSGRVDGDRSIHVPWDGPALTSRQRVEWSVRVWDGDGGVHESGPASFEMGLLEAGDWAAAWITLPRPVDGPYPSPFLRRAFEVGPGLVSARLYATAAGLYEASLNGDKVGDQYLRPGWTDYHRRLPYQTYDVTDQVGIGDNVLGVVLGDGWYAGHLGWADVASEAPARHVYGDTIQVLAQLELRYDDGRVERVVTDEQWRGRYGPIVSADLQMGSTYDARLELDGWDTAGFDASGWDEVATGPGVTGALEAQMMPGIRKVAELPALSVTESSPGAYVYDLGQNMVGWVRLEVTAPVGTEITLRFGETLDDAGNVYTDNLRQARSTDVYIARGTGTEVHEPRFTFHGFRYVEITGWPEGTPPVDAVTGVVVSTDLPITGELATSHPMVNQLVSNILWGQRGNFLDVPTDCPQRDERLGWMGDAQIFVPTATFNMDAAPFFSKWMNDVGDAQTDDGAFPDVAPKVKNLSKGAPAWGDAGVIVPWTIYSRYGDVRHIDRHFDNARRWVDYLDQANPSHLWLEKRRLDFGDWLSIDADTPKDTLATAFFARSTDLVARMAGVLGRDDEATRYRALFDAIRVAFNDAFVEGDGAIKDETQTCYALALRFGLLPDDKRAAAAQRLVDDIARHDGHLTTGFVGIAHLLPVLTDTGHLDVAYRLLLNDTFPSWGFTIKHGATTMWERWDGWTPERGFQTTDMNSFNHYSFGSVGEWLYRTVAGIDVDFGVDPDQPVRIAPRPGGGLTHVAGRYRSVLGDVACEWIVAGDRISISAQAPSGGALVDLPDAQPAFRVSGGRHDFEVALDA
jgi:alpha-L-rhamnosidase